MDRTARVLKFYGNGVIQLLIEPSLFFWALPAVNTTGRTLGFMALSAGFYAGAGLLTGPKPVAAMALIYFINAVGMAALGAGLGWCAMVMVFGKKQGFSLVLGIYAYASGVTLLISWLPFMLWFTEPWKYWLVYTGFKKGCNLTGRQALAVLAISLPLQWCLIYSALKAVAG